MKYYASIRRFAYVLVKNDDVADDIAQETFYAAVKSVRRHGLEGDPRPWLTKIAFNMVRSLWRSRHERHLGYLANPQNVECAGMGVIDGVVERERARLIKDAVAELKPKYEKLIRGFYFEDKSCRDLAKEHETDPTTVRVGLYRGRNLLAVMLRDLATEG